ncbi:hypothetical protein [Micromonospora sp. RL09-050-HVF-A]|uniref:hypothetical protein n=1 Tax=Micromonospora sp. RL09-050-HVF-A TaxID=1703433 RepID=UPI001C5CE1B5|nr:hypothetical protein [Micromonospora sp. RL09-050-HVF-A]MBW4703679.1 hypothetical protein [Micromonospora sp. RL09-050-HVF-A]
MTLLPLSGSQFDRLGKRLADGAASDDDEKMFEEVRIRYGRALEIAQHGLSALELPATGRVKTTGTLIDKLRRTPGLTIRGVHDLAGSRVLVRPVTLPKGFRIEGAECKRDFEARDGLLAQEIAVRKILNVFVPPLASKMPKEIDRRANPSHGYRAVHVVVFLEGLPVEVQVRTELQHMWAEATERLGDRWGRGLRYGLGPDEPDKSLFRSAAITRERFVELLQRLSVGIATYEEAQHVIDKAELQLSFTEQPASVDLWHHVEQARDALESARNQIRGALGDVADIVEELGTHG